MTQRELTIEQEQELGRRIAQGDNRALDRLVTANLGFVVSVAKKYAKNGVSLDDLISEGNIAMMLAAQKWDPEKEERFVKYAVWDIQRAISQEVTRQSSVVTTTLSEQKSKAQIIKAKKQLEQKNQTSATDYDVASELNIKAKRVGETMRVTRSHISMDAPLHANSRDSFGSSIPGKEDSQSQSTDNMLFFDAMNDVMDVLNERERRVITLYYGIGEVAITMAEIAEQMNLKRERVRQIRKKAEQKLRSPLKQMKQQ